MPKENTTSNIGPLRVQKSLKSRLKKYLSDKDKLTMEAFCIQAITEKLEREKAK